MIYVIIGIIILFFWFISYTSDKVSNAKDRDARRARDAIWDKELFMAWLPDRRVISETEGYDIYEVADEYKDDYERLQSLKQELASFKPSLANRMANITRHTLITDIERLEDTIIMVKKEVA